MTARYEVRTKAHRGCTAPWRPIDRGDIPPALLELLDEPETQAVDINTTTTYRRIKGNQ